MKRTTSYIIWVLYSVLVSSEPEAGEAYPFEFKEYKNNSSKYRSCGC